jgi:hypothetical protein
MRYLSKSDFKVAQTCPTKLYYKKCGYPSTMQDNAYLAMLADGGYIVEKIAKLRYHGGIEIGFDRSPDEAFRATLDALRAENVTLFEATLIHDGKLARVDILDKCGSDIRLIEVKAKSYDSRKATAAKENGSGSVFRKQNGEIAADWKEYLEDVTFQVLVLRGVFPHCDVQPYLCMPDKAETTRIEGLNRMFQLRRVVREGVRHDRIVVDFTGDLALLDAEDFLVTVPVSDEVTYLAEEVGRRAEQYRQSLEPQLHRINVPLTTFCGQCEYRASVGDARDGFRECWGKLADAQPHILDLHRAGKVAGGNGMKADDLIRERNVRLFDVTEDNLRKANGEMGEWGKRQWIQIEHTRKSTEWLSDRLAGLLRKFEYPLHFIDFETTTLAVPYHSGMHPYAPVAFQWSCHAIAEPGGTPEHREWINVTDAFPNFEFAQSLMQCIGTTGTVFKYAPHETTILSAIRRQMAERGHQDAILAAWLDEMSEKARIVDMLQIVVKNYFHPLMKGSNSIKKVVDGIWQTNPSLRSRFPDFVKEVDGRLLSPYASLPPLEIQGQPVVVAEGTGAMRAYEAMMYGLEWEDTDVRARWKQLLLQYCKLDTLAMVMLWQHWSQRISETGKGLQKN